MFRLHVTNRNGFLQKTFNLTKDDPDPAPELLPLAALLAYVKEGKKQLVQVFMQRLKNPQNKLACMTVLKYCLSNGGPGGRIECLLSAEEIQTLKRICLQDTFCKTQNFKIQSLGLLF